MISSKARYILGSTAVAVGGGAYFVSKDEGSQRSLTFWWNVFPIFLHYRGIQFLNRDTKLMGNETADKLYSECNDKYTDRVRDLTYSMRGFYLKQAQLMSVQDDFVPAPYMRWMKDTQDNVPSEFKPGEAIQYVRKLCSEELGKDFDSVFSEFDEEPLGVASIGQVHKAVLRENGKTVAVKILVPGIEPKFRADIRTLKLFCQLAMPQHVPAFDEIERQFLTEFDYTREAANLNTAREFSLARWGDDIVIPEAFRNLCTKHMLIMEFLDGVKLVDGVRNQYKKLAALSGRTLEEMEKEMKDLIKSGKFEYKSVEEEKAKRAKTVQLLLLKDIYETNALRFIYNISPLRLLYGPKSYEWTEPPIDLGVTLELLAKIQSASIFYDGFFNGDAHPGNILLLRDGRIGLIDYGQVKKMSIDERIKYAKLIVAHSRKDIEEVARITFDELGTVTKYKRPDIAYLHSCFWNDRMTKDVMGDKNIAEFIDYIEAQDPVVILPDTYLFAARSSVMLRGMGKAFGLELVISPLWKQDAELFLKSQGVKY